MSSLLRVACSVSVSVSVDDGRPNGIMAPVAGWTRACTYSTALARSRRQPVLWRGRDGTMVAGLSAPCDVPSAFSTSPGPGASHRIASHRLDLDLDLAGLDWNPARRGDLDSTTTVLVRQAPAPLCVCSLWSAAGDHLPGPPRGPTNR